jgi:hypothetical protein
MIISGGRRSYRKITCAARGPSCAPARAKLSRQKLQQARKSGAAKKAVTEQKRSIKRIPQAGPAHKDVNIGDINLVVHFSCERSSDMASDVNNRVLGRRGARTLSNQELNTVTGGTIKVTPLPSGEVDILADT